MSIARKLLLLGVATISIPIFDTPLLAQTQPTPPPVEPYPEPYAVPVPAPVPVPVPVPAPGVVVPYAPVAPLASPYGVAGHSRRVSRRTARRVSRRR